MEGLTPFGKVMALWAWPYGILHVFSPAYKATAMYGIDVAQHFQALLLADNSTHPYLCTAACCNIVFHSWA